MDGVPEEADAVTGGQVRQQIWRSASAYAFESPAHPLMEGLP
jgi:hypothetical protein